MAIVSSFVRLITFRSSKEEMESYGRAHLIAGIFITWIVGMGRYWDHPEAQLWQYFGVGSLIYVFILSAFIFFLLLPLKIPNLRYHHLLTFITMTSLPAILYAVPSEKIVDINTAVTLNVYALEIVALWRVALLFFYLKRFLNLSIFSTIVTVFLPLVLIVSALSVLNLEHATFQIMGGIRESTSKDGSYGIVLLLTFFAWIFLLPSLISYAVIIYKRRKSFS
jgi:hypothetical protein